MGCGLQMASVTTNNREVNLIVERQNFYGLQVPSSMRATRAPSTTKGTNAMCLKVPSAKLVSRVLMVIK